MSIMVPGSGAKTEYLTVIALKDSFQGYEKLIWCDKCNGAVQDWLYNPRKLESSLSLVGPDDFCEEVTL